MPGDGNAVGCKPIDPVVLERRRFQQSKQVFFGKSTKGYINYRLLVPLEERTTEHPVTPRFNPEFSKRKTIAELSRWRQILHRWDNPDPTTSIADRLTDYPAESWQHQPYAL